MGQARPGEKETYKEGCLTHATKSKYAWTFIYGYYFAFAEECTNNE